MIILQWTPSPLEYQGALAQIRRDLQDLTEPLTTSIVDVIGPSLQDNFDFGGRPAWAPLSAYTVAKKGHDDILIDTGALRDAAGDLSSWDIGRTDANLANIEDYGYYHNSGFFNVQFDIGVQARMWALYQDEDIDEIVEVWWEWLEMVIEAAMP